jgi:uncharacterized protein (TIGR02145 family)
MKKLILSFAFIAMSIVSYAQVGIGTTDPHATSALEIKSTTKGFLPPRLSITQAIAIENPAEGLTFYCTDCDIKGLFFFNGVSFIGVVDGLGLSAVLDASNAVLAQIGTEADSNTSTITIAQLNAILPSLTDVNGSYESFYRTYIGSNAGLFGSPAAQAEVQTAITLVNIAQVPTVNGQNNTVWMDRDLGASRVAQASNDEDSYGNLYQWGRASDGHEVIVWENSTSSNGDEQGSGNETSQQVSTTNPSHGKFIYGSGNWIAKDVNQNVKDDLWQGVNGVNNPCPTGFRVPTKIEWEDEINFWGNSPNSGDAFTSVLKLPVAGHRNSGNGSLRGVGSYGSYWSSSVAGNFASGLYFDSSTANMHSSRRAGGFSVRCIKE